MKKMTPIKIILIFLAASQLWIVLTDLLLSRIATNPEMFTRLSMIKGGLYVAVTGTLLYWLISRYAAERGRAEEAYRNSEQQLRDITDTVPAYIALVGIDDLRYKFVNSKFEQGFGIPRNEIIGRHIREIIGDANYQFALTYIEQVRATRSQVSYENTFDLKQGKRWINVNYVPTFDGQGAVTDLIVMSLDITERKLAEKSLRESEAYFKGLIDFLPDAVLTIDLDGRVTGWNKAMESLTGVKAEQMLGKGDYEYALPFYGERRPILIDLVALPDEQLEGRYSNILREGDALYADTYLPLGGRGAYLHGRARMLRNADGQPVGAIEVIHDLTDRKRAEQEREKLIGELQTAIAEIRTLQGILPICSFCKKIRDDKGAWKQVEAYISDHTDAVFSHGFCEDCGKKHYPNMYQKGPGTSEGTNGSV